MEMCGIRAEKAADTGRLIRILWFNASRQGAVNLGAFLIQRGNILVASSFLGLSAAASYGMTVTILMALSGVSVVICQIQMPQMNRLQASGERQLLRAMYGEIVILACAAYMIGLAAVVIWGGQLLDLMGSSTDLLPQAAVLTLGVILLLELNHSIAASYLTTTNQVPFLWAALVSGVVTTLLSISLVHQWKIWGLILAQGGVQLMYNNWKWPHEAALHLGTKWVEILVLGARKIVENARH
jgi:O-antigen/teichoic acid export membrane protein